MGLFDYLFGSKKEEIKAQPKPPIQPNQQVAENDWMYDSILQYITSPIWKVNISEFIDSNCLVFDDEEENKIEYQNIHKKFKKLMEQLVDGMLGELMINEQSFEQQVMKGLRSEKHKSAFEQLLIIDNFLVFKKMMIKRNKEQELEALKALQQFDINNNQAHQSDADQIRKLELEKEKAEIEHAIELSKAVEAEKRKLLEQEEDEFNKAILMSQRDYQEFLRRQQEELKKKEDEIKKQLLSQQQQQQQQPVQPVKVNENDTPTPVLKSQFGVQGAPVVQVAPVDQVQEQPPSLMNIYKEKHHDADTTQIKIQQKQTIEEVEQKKLDPIHSNPSRQLPPMKVPVINQVESVIHFEANDDAQKEHDKLIMQQQIEKLKRQQTDQLQPADGQEGIDDRKRRLALQREMIRKKKQEESQKELQDYKDQNNEKRQQPIEQQTQDQSQVQFEQQKKSTSEELQRRREALERKKKEVQRQKELEKEKEKVNEDFEVDLL